MEITCILVNMISEGKDILWKIKMESKYLVSH